jgi:hypothetical protein
MPRYYFNLYRPDAPPFRDDEGLELESDAVAKRKALESLPEMLAETLSDELKPVCVSVEVVRRGSGVVKVVTAKIEFEPQP